MAKITGAKAHAARLKRIASGSMRRQVGKAVYVAAGEIGDDAAHSITEGAVSGKHHVASLPGEPPNADTHLLDRSIHVEKVTDVVMNVVADAPYAAKLEFGDSKVAARPFMKPAAARGRKRAQRIVTEAVRRVIKGQAI